MAVYGREDDLVLALREATQAMAVSGRFEQTALSQGDVAAAQEVIKVAEVYIAWLRKLASAKLVLVALEKQDGTVLATFTEGEKSVSSIKTDQQLRYVIDAADDRGFAVDASLQVTVSDPNVVSATILEATSGTASGKDELVVVAVAPGSSLVKVFDPANPDTIFGSDSVDVVVGDVAAVVLENPTVEAQPAPAPAPTPAA